MGSVYAQKVRGIHNPTVGLLNVGTEDKKGNELAKQTFQLLKESNLNFIGNVEARDLMNSVADVVVTDGYTGNIALKAIEGTALAMFSLIKDAMLTNFTSKLAAAVLKPNLKGVKKKMDYSEYGGAALFGLKSPVIKAHGSSDAMGIFSAIKQTQTMVEHNVVKLVSDHMEKIESNA
jgi:glycerol-3-phosphate acyltransferase PlsX